MRLLLKCTVLSACSTRSPLIRSRTSFAFCGLVRWNLASARNSRIFSTAALAMIFFLEGQTNYSARFSLFGLCRGLGGAPGVAFEGARGRKLAELVANHVLGHIHRDKLAAIVNRNGVADEVRVNGGTARPGTENLFVVGLVHDGDLAHQVVVDEGTFFR